MKKLFLIIYQLIFSPWEIEIIERGQDKFKRIKNIHELTADACSRKNWRETTDPFIHYTKNFVIYKYVHKFFKKEKLVKKYID